VWDCYIQARRPEGHRGLYRGASPFIFGLVPQRGFQLAMYYSFNEKFGDTSSPYSVFSQAFSGACAGLTQALLAYSSEAKQINLQLRRATEWRHRAPPFKMNFYPQRASEWRHFSFGTLKGLEPILLREVPFSATFFPAYSYIKQSLSERHEDVKPWLIALVAGSAAALPSSMLTTPADVINTRLQATQRMGDVKYDGIVDCAKSILKHEGYSALFKGSFLRTLRLAPVLGVTMAAYTELPPVLGWLHLETKNSGEKEDFRTTYPTRAIGNKTEDIESLLEFMGVTPPRKHTDKKGSEDKGRK
jgi:solute carrier family 25 (mitochondrial aspartate/glutamate transporter), member 12/13